MGGSRSEREIEVEEQPDSISAGAQPELIIGYHGTTEKVATTILNQSYPILDRRMRDWLGDGLYFWQDAPHRALWWANRRVRYEQRNHPERGPHAPAVLRAVINLTAAIDFLDRGPMIERLLAAMFQLQSMAGGTPLRNDNDEHFLDCAIMNTAIEYRMSQSGIAHNAVRGVFVNDNPQPYFPGSALLKEAHVQVAVRTWDVMSVVERVDLTKL